MSPLTQRLREEIQARGPLGFDRFMEWALYHPEHGYYERAQPRMGRGGDYYTSVSVGSVFGELLGFRFARWLSGMGPGRLQLVEAGAHEGRLAADILRFLETYEPELAGRLEYWLWEPSERRRAWQSERLAAFAPRVRWAGAGGELPRVRGVIFSNELLDALPVQCLRWEGAETGWRELGVAWEDGRFVWTTLPGDPGPIGPDLAPELRAALPVGYRIEVGRAAGAWWREAAAALETGWLLTFDYGDGPGERWRPERTAGTLRAYRQHRVSSAVLEAPGEQDVTAQVDFAALQAVGEAAGLVTAGRWRQEAFLGAILAELEAGGGRFPVWTAPRRRQCLTLMHPAQLGTCFQVLGQRRGPS